MSNIHFFTEVDLLNQQQANEAFGPVPGNENTKFQVVSKHTASSTPKAYAVVGGTVFVQEDQDDSSLLNLILKPDEQPRGDFPKIDFFVYRGIKKSSLIDGDKIALSNNNELTELLWLIQDDLDEARNENEDAPDKALGIHHTSGASGPEKCENSDPVQKVFHKDYDDHQFPKIKGGAYIGDFDENGFGFQIVIERPGYELLFKDIRKGDHYIEVSSLSSNPSQPEEFEHWHDKEEILNYLDPCAFYGSAYRGGILLRSGTNDAEGKFKDDIFHEILVNDPNNPVFFNRNVIYVDVRNEHNKSFNYYKNYGSLSNDDAYLHMAFEEGVSLSDLNYYRDNWPVLLLEPSDFPSGNTGEMNLIRIAFPEGDNKDPIVFLAQSYWGNNFLEDFQMEKERDRFNHLNVDSQQTGEVTLGVPNGNSSGTEPVSCYVRLRYLKGIDENEDPSSDTVIRSKNYLDNLALPFESLKSWDYSPDQRKKAFGERFFVDARIPFQQSSMSNFEVMKDEQDDITFIFSRDVPDTGYGLIPSQKFTSKSQRKTANDETFFDSVNEEHPDLRKVPRQIMTENSNGFERRGVISLEDNRVIPSFLKESIQNLHWLNIKKDDFDELEKIYNSTSSNPYGSFEANFEKKYGVHLGLKEVVRTTSANAIDFGRYEFVLRGFSIENGVLQVREVITEVYTDIIETIRSLFDDDHAHQDLQGPGFDSNEQGYQINENTPDNESSEIEATIYLDFSNGQSQFVQLEIDAITEYIQDNIEIVWNTDTNSGLNPEVDGQNKNIVTNLSFNIILPGQNPPNNLNENELYVRIERGGNRSFVEGNKRKGVFIMRDENFWTVYDNGSMSLKYHPLQNHHMPAHEFGHFLGLADRYTYVGYADGRPFMNHQNSEFTSLFVPEGYDEEYSTFYRWHHNLMSTSDEIPLNFTNMDGIYGEATYQQLYLEFQPIMELGVPMQYQRLTIFITSKQWDIIRNYEDEFEENKNTSDFYLEGFLRYAYYVLFKGIQNFQRVNADEEFQGTFGGVMNNEGDLQTVSDHRYVLFDSEANNDYDHRMHLRIRDWASSATPPNEQDPPTTADSLLDAFKAYFSPYWHFDNNNNLDKDEWENVLVRSLDLSELQYRLYLLSISCGQEYPNTNDVNHWPVNDFIMELYAHIENRQDLRPPDANQEPDFFEDFGDGDNTGKNIWESENTDIRRIDEGRWGRFSAQYEMNRWLIVELIRVGSLEHIPNSYTQKGPDNGGFEFF